MIRTYKFEQNNVFIWKCPDDSFENGSNLIVGENQCAVFAVNGMADAVYTAGEYIFGEDIAVEHASLYIIDSTVTMSADWETDGAVEADGRKMTLAGEMSFAVKDAKALVAGVESADGIEQMLENILEQNLNNAAKEAVSSKDAAQYLKQSLCDAFAAVGVTVAELSVSEIKEIKEKTKKKRNTKKIAAIVISLTAACAALAIVAVTLVIPAVRYSSAMKAIENKDYISAYDTLRALGGYSDSKQKLAEIEVPVAKARIALTDENEVITFGTYEQDNDLSNGAEDLEWVIIKKEEGKVLLSTKYAIDAKPFNTNDGPYMWESCSIRKWLNNEFYSTAFNEQQQSMIAETKNITNTDNSAEGINNNYFTTDKVFLFSYNELYKYVPDILDRQIQSTPYARANGGYSDPDTLCCWYWLRSPGTTSSQASFANLEGYAGYEGDGVGNPRICVRPVIWLNVE